MRVTSNTFPDALVSQLGDLSTRQNKLQNQAATGQVLQLPEDNPAAMRRVLDLQAQASATNQYQSNIARQQDVATATYTATKSLKTISDRASEIATLADGLKSPEELNAYATEINQLIQQAAQVANTKNNGDYLFAGTRSDQPAFAVTTDVNGQVTAVTYQGNESVATSEIAENVTLSAQVPGANSSGAGPRGLLSDSRSGADFFNHLISLRDHLTSGNTAAISSADKNKLANDEDNFIYHIGLNGAMQSRLEATSAMTKDRAASLTSQVSNQADADLAQTLVRLSQTQNAYQAALQSAGSMLNVSLLDYLK